MRIKRRMTELRPELFDYMGCVNKEPLTIKGKSYPATTVLYATFNARRKRFLWWSYWRVTFHFAVHPVSWSLLLVTPRVFVTDLYAAQDLRVLYER
jgi:hypothetical protein